MAAFNRTTTGRGWRTSASLLAALVLLAGSASLPAPAWGWASIQGWVDTHSAIIRLAYEILARDPAFAPSAVPEHAVRDAFPTVDQILGYEGATGLGIWGPQGGAGPDAPGNSPYSAHYYNPSLQRVSSWGGAPTHVRTHLAQLISRTQIGTRSAGSARDLAGRSAAYGGHFVADMFVPYHVIGMARDDLQMLVANYGTQDLQRVVPHITAAVYGSEALRIYATGTASASMLMEIRRFLASQDDWFAPFYYNGNSTSASGMSYVKDSSHVVWEGMVKIPEDLLATSPITRATPEWKNPPVASVRSAAEALPFFTRFAELQATQAEAFTKTMAHRTRGGLGYFGTERYTTIQLLEAIQGVYTLWRASFSALRPMTNETAGPQGMVAVSGLLNTAGTEPAQNVWLRLTGAGCTVQGAEIQPFPGQWSLAPGTGPCTLTLEAIAAFTGPDLQYGRYSKTIDLGRDYTARGRSYTSRSRQPQAQTPGITIPGVPPSAQPQVPAPPALPQGVQEGLDAAKKFFGIFGK